MRKAFNMLQNVDISTNRTVATYSKAVKATVQRKLQTMQENWWSDRCDEIQEASNANNSKLFYPLLKKVYGPISSKVAPFRSKDGTALLTNPKDIVGRWKEYFDELLNRPTEVHLTFLDNIPERPIKKKF
uniref:Uncharacterized protein n=1 Tax=Octopus bimaculoides TaxID=37653 RepID=A0A0L8HTC0_OCTBM